MKKKIKIISVILLCFFLTACSKKAELDPTISFLTSWKEYFANFGLFSGLLVYPLSQAINFVSKYCGVFVGIFVVTLIFESVMYQFDKKSEINNKKSELLKPEVQKIKEYYNKKKVQDEEHKEEYDKECLAEIEKLYKTNGTSASLIMMIAPFIRIPFYFAMYYSVIRADAVVNGSFLGANLIMTPLEGLKNGTFVLFGIYLLMGAAYFCSSNMSSWLNPPKEKPEKMDKWKMFSFLLLVLIMGIELNWQTSVSLYWFISSVISICKTVIIYKKGKKEIEIVPWNEPTEKIIIENVS